MLRKLRNKLSPPVEARGVVGVEWPKKIVDRCGRHPGRKPPCASCTIDCQRRQP